ncbi:MAG: multidrug efflux RND transporter permease subunit [Verrucomicrobiota bacterium]|nr:multidrug efflux RND transporter permease subunit [Verrucomicrobiota bacterium]
MISRFFIERPVFAMSIALLITFAGFVAMRNLPIELYPNMTPPLIQVTTNYNGANAEVMAGDVSSPLEQQILGVEDMIYMYSQNGFESAVLNVYFSVGSNADMAQVNVQNEISQAMAQLPSAVQQQGVTIYKQMPNILMVVSMQSPGGRYDQTYVSNYASINVVNALSLLPGISNVKVIGQRNYAMRIWLRPDLMAQMSITPSDVVTAIREQNQDFGLGELGMEPNVHSVPMTIPFSTKGRLSTPEDFEKIVLRAYPDGAMVLLRDIGSVTLGAQNYMMDSELNGVPCVSLAIYQEYGSNALSVAESVHSTMADMAKHFPSDLAYSIPYDSTLFIKGSIHEVERTIVEAALLVMLVVLLFLQKWRATIIPVVAMLVSIIGTFAGMYLLGYSINMLTLFGLVLAVGIVVDDAIVVVENIERNLHEHHLSAKEAAIRAMQEVTAPIIAIVFALCAVFIPVAFLGGIAGQLYRQFALTIAISVAISGFVALTLSPAMGAILLKEQPVPFWGRLFNAGFEKITRAYVFCTEKFFSLQWLALLLFTALLGTIGYLFISTPKSLVPQEDQGYLIALAYLPDGASLDRTVKVNTLVEELSKKNAGVDQIVSLTGFSLIESLARTGVGTTFIVLKDWDKRKADNLSAAAIQQELNQLFMEKIDDAIVIVANPPAIQGLGTVGGLEFWIENRGDGGNDLFEQVLNEFIAKSKNFPMIRALHPTTSFDNMTFNIQLDRYKARMLGVGISDVFEAVQTLIGSVYVNNFNKFGRVYQVIVQAEPSARERLSDLGDMYVRSSFGQMVPLKALLTVEMDKGMGLVTRFNDFPAVELLAIPAPGYTSGQAIEALQTLSQDLPEDFFPGWSGIAYQEIATGGTSATVLLAALLIIFLILAALYEKWSAPLAILFAVPFGIFGAFVAIYLRGLPDDVYFQIGLVTLIALSAKNAILIVEFALMKRQEGLSTREAAISAARLRFRAILMTSITFIVGVLPLVISKGAGAASRHAVGTGVMGGMIAATTLALFFVPLFFTWLCREKR